MRFGFFASAVLLWVGAVIMLTWPVMAGLHGPPPCFPESSGASLTPRWRLGLVWIQVLLQAGILFLLALNAYRALPRIGTLFASMAVAALILPAIATGVRVPELAAANVAVVALFSMTFFLGTATAHGGTYRQAAVLLGFVLAGTLLAASRPEHWPAVLVLPFAAAYAVHGQGRGRPKVLPLAFLILMTWAFAADLGIEHLVRQEAPTMAVEPVVSNARPPMAGAAWADPIGFLNIRVPVFISALGHGGDKPMTEAVVNRAAGCPRPDGLSAPGDAGIPAAGISNDIPAWLEGRLTTFPQWVFCVVLIFFYRSYPVSAAIALALLSKAMMVFLFVPAPAFPDLYDLHVIGLLFPLMMAVEYSLRSAPQAAVQPDKPRMLLSFGVVSGLGWITDFGIFGGLGSIGVPVWAANFCGASIAVLLVFFLSVRRIFLYHGHYIIRKLVAYAIYQVVVITAASILIDRIADLGIHMLIAKILVTPLTFYSNFQFMSFITTGRLRWA